MSLIHTWSAIEVPNTALDQKKGQEVLQRLQSVLGCRQRVPGVSKVIRNNDPSPSASWQGQRTGLKIGHLLPYSTEGRSPSLLAQAK